MYILEDIIQEYYESLFFLGSEKNIKIKGNRLFHRSKQVKCKEKNKEKSGHGGQMTRNLRQTRKQGRYLPKLSSFQKM